MVGEKLLNLSLILHGRNVHFDYAVLKKRMSILANLFKYRLLDQISIEILMRIGGRKREFFNNKALATQYYTSSKTRHRATVDFKKTLDELREVVSTLEFFI